MLPRWNRLWALLCLFLVIQLASAESFRIARRQDGNTSDKTTAVETGADSESKTQDGKTTKTADASAKSTEGKSSGEVEMSVTETTTTEAKSTKHSTTATATSTSTGTFDDSNYLNATIPAGQLPLKPRITPGWGVAGVIMLLTGVAYALIGIKNKWIHTFFSTAYVAALGVAVLIVYVMDDTVSDALQGGYVVAVVVAGCGLGAASIMFRELLEGLGCALGGFCVSMWLLCLVSGGLLKSVAPRAVFIACFTVGGFAFYFSRYTRDWALIVMIAFTGSTVTVLGIDCFSRAGLKEFWAWIWDLNEDLFPLGGQATYPVTKGIRVETAAIIIIFMMGVISQIKLWKIVREQREKRAEDFAEGQRNLRAEEEIVGREIERANARERRQWERTYGSGEASSTLSPNSENGDGVSEKRLRSSHTGSSQRQSSVEAIEMSDLADTQRTPKPATTASVMANEQKKDERVTVRVASDDISRAPSVRESNDKAIVAPSDDQTSTFIGSEDERRAPVPQSFAPKVVPLPFIVPVADDTISEADRSSVATFADDDDGQTPTIGPRHSLAQRLSRLSHGSAELLRSFSHRSGRPNDDFAEEHNGSTEDLVVPGPRPRDDDNGSMAATVDDESVSAGNRRSLPISDIPKSIEITAELSDREMLSPPLGEQAKLQDMDAKSTGNHSRADLSEDHASEGQAKTKSAVSATSARVSLTKERLPRSLSRVALSYRTNEWAKHLSNAEAPHLEDIRITEPQAQEPPAPVFVEELQKSADEGTPAPAITRSDSQVSNMSFSLPKRSTKQNVPAALAILTGDSQNRSPGTTPTSGGMPRSSSTGLRRTSGGFEPIAEERDTYLQATTIPEEAGMRSSSSTPPTHLTNSHRSITPGLVSYSSPQTLLGQREMVVRNKSQGNLVASTSDLNLYRASSDVGSLSNYPMYAAAVGADADDLPLSQRKQLMRQNSLNPMSSTPSLARLSGGHEASVAEKPFESHQPQRVSTVTSPAAREAALSHFRQSVAHDLRSGTPVINNTGRETPFTPNSLLGGGREAEVQRNIDMGRNILMGQKEAEAQRRETEQRQKEWNDRVFDERMRNGDLLEVHREAMRKMQKHAKDQ
ncbi:hypothetical protein AK830_g5044 [Neonectria ditissima]|uniref:TM7S3/TM198-like domain-containing protein n=1 Tax=Neonectria ditissima TaxID=78410 RepID=A0A0P7BF37_9HYPO|nr:hypothetical protein AK830_g5044 [Neonectria ditissima]